MVDADVGVELRGGGLGEAPQGPGLVFGVRKVETPRLTCYWQVTATIAAKLSGGSLRSSLAGTSDVALPIAQTDNSEKHGTLTNSNHEVRCAVETSQPFTNIDVSSAQIREGRGSAQIFGVCPQSEISQFAAAKLSQTLARVNGYENSNRTSARDTNDWCWQISNHECATIRAGHHPARRPASHHKRITPRLVDWKDS